MRTSKLPEEDKRYADNSYALSFYQNAKLHFYVYRLTSLHLWENFSLPNLSIIYYFLSNTHKSNKLWKLQFRF